MKKTIKIAVIAMMGLSLKVKAQNTLPNDGNVGIGTLTPIDKLQIQEGNLRIYGLNTSRYLRFTESRLQGAFINYDGSKNVLNIGVNNVSSNDASNDNNSISISRGTGNVGIGTTGPIDKLQIQEGNLRIYGLNTSRYLRFTESRLQGAFINYDGSKNVLNIGVNNVSSNDVSNDNNSISISRGTGNVGIKTNDTKGFELGVNGKIAANEVKVAIYPNWPDFVFYDNYNLPTLKEVESHIKEKGHLKDIPSAEEIEKNGFFLGEMNSKLLQKIEELTLYTIVQEKKLKTQEKKFDEQNYKIENQQKEIDELKSLVQKLIKDKN
ncbi:hypothetical protein SAMN04489761_3570 [Tenacibaculum sp. MAR_2009_124]|uniref:hypothetical protein n=1 Tax=Tenacibaculum sp. MAR_2009_124 TaxID=1250059 RepID=UPI000897D596|nr:hypothetical protein [Tenacibaculum sp. MAR_2009_124]SEC78376.1 hypothetical protein SAMN04489761_3570 [Tenacibaculum sp. MAR_2009_124]